MRKPNSHKAFLGGGGANNPLIATLSGLFGKFTRTGYGFAKKGSKKVSHPELSHASVQRNVAIASNRDLRKQNTECAVRRCNDAVGAVPIHSKACFLFSFGTFLISLIAKRKRKVHRTRFKRDCFATLAMTGQRAFAFTLAEVLIVLAVLGVVAAMTIPNLIQDYKEKATVTAVKKAYSILNQAVDMSVADNGPVETWDWGTSRNGQSAVNVFRENLKPYLRLEKDCGTGAGCWAGRVNNLHGQAIDNFNVSSYFAKALLVDGTSLGLNTRGSCNNNYGTSTALKHVCASIFVDINGASQPNSFGKDIFIFWVTAEGVIPVGTVSDWGINFSVHCNLNDTSSSSGQACAAWVIKKENMDYLRETVSW